jgi:hypothetical protein
MTGDFYFPANLLINRATFITVGIYSGAYHHTGARIYSLPKKFAPLIMQVQTKAVFCQSWQLFPAAPGYVGSLACY